MRGMESAMTEPERLDVLILRKRDMVEREVAAHLQNYQASGAELITPVTQPESQP
jgi:hypothetical protein